MTTLNTKIFVLFFGSYTIHTFNTIDVIEITIISVLHVIVKDVAASAINFLRNSNLNTLKSYSEKTTYLSFATLTASLNAAALKDKM